MSQIRVLHIVPNMQAGGLETFIMNMMRNMDSKKIQFDFLVHYQEKKFYDEEIEFLGGKIYRFSIREDKNIIKYLFQLNQFFKIHKEYKLIHCHMESLGFIIFFIAKIHGVKVRIAHSHNINTENNLKGKIKYCLSRFFKYLSTDNFACSKDAGTYLFQNDPYKIIPNAIDLDKFQFSQTKRDKIRKELNINKDTIVIGHIGRFCKQKNHNQLIDIFDSYQKKNLNTKLILVGTGEELDHIKQKIENLNLTDKVILLSNRKDTDYLYCAFDIFLFPSLFEGLGIVLIEAQTSGLMCYTTDEVVPTEACISDRLQYIKLNDNWSNKLITNNQYDRKNINFNNNKENYNIKKIAKQLETFYLEKNKY